MTSKVAVGIEGLSEVQGDVAHLADEDFKRLNTSEGDAAVVIFYAGFASFAAHQLEQTSESSLSALKQSWLEQGASLVSLVKQNRAHTTLLNSDIAARDPEALGHYASTVSIKQKQSIWTLFALQFQQGDDEIKRQELLLEALATPLADTTESTKIDLEAIQYALVSERNDRTQLKAQLEEITEHLREQLNAQDVGRSSAESERDKLIEEKTSAEEENKLILEQLFKAQEELEVFVLENKQLKERESQVAEANGSELNDLKSQLEKLREQLKEQEIAKSIAEVARDKLTEEKASVEAENKLILEQLFKVQEELEAYVIDNQQLKERDVQELVANTEDLNALERQLKDLRSQLKTREANEKSLTEKLKIQTSAKLDIEAEREKLINEKERAEEENKLVIEQLFKVQEELERYYLAGNESAQQVAKLKSEVERKNDKLHQFSQKIKHLETTMDALKGYPEAIQALTKPAPSPKSMLGKVKRRIKPLPVKSLDLLHLVKQSPLFDESYYLQEYPDVAQERCDPALHFLKYGGFEGRNPGPRFNSEWYLKQNPDVGEVKMNPLVHFLMYGAAEGRLAYPPRSKQESK